jgi:anti-sigma-K factor RskA
MAEHPDLVEWALGQLDPDETCELEAHLDACAACRRDADELRGAHVMLERAAPPFEVPAGLEQRVLPQPRRRRLPRLAWLSLPAAATAAATAAILVSSGPAVQRLALRSTTGEDVAVTAAVRVTPVGRDVELDIERLRDPRPDGLYELWFVSADGRRRVSAGTFHPDEQGRGTVRLLAAADPVAYPRLSVTLEPSDGDPRRTGPEVLR